MLDTVLEKLGGLLPKNFLIAAFFPVLLFAGANGVMLYLVRPNFRNWVVEYLDLNPVRQAYYAFPILIVIAAAAYVFSMLNLPLRRILEGVPPFVSLKQKSEFMQPLSRQQRTKLDRLEKTLKDHKRKWWMMKRQEQGWYQSLTDAYRKGIGQTARCSYTDETEAARKLDSLMDRRAANDLIEVTEITESVSSLGQELAKCNLNARDVKDQEDYNNKQSLDSAHTTMRELINYAVNRVEDEYAEYYNHREYHYSRYRIAPTTMGNVAESVRGYALSRYGMNLDPLWIRVQTLVQQDKDFYASLQDAKTQLDFLVSLCWLTIIFTAFWLVYLISARQRLALFLLIGVLGPTLAFMWYAIAVQNYLAFADVLRTALDLYRFKLLDVLHIARPRNSDEEREIWSQINHAIGFGEGTTIVYKTDETIDSPKPATTARPNVESSETK